MFNMTNSDWAGTQIKAHPKGIISASVPMIMDRRNHKTIEVYFSLIQWFIAVTRELTNRLRPDPGQSNDCVHCNWWVTRVSSSSSSWNRLKQVLAWFDNLLLKVLYTYSDINCCFLIYLQICMECRKRTIPFC